MVRSVSKNRMIRNLFNKLTPIYHELEKSLYWGQVDKWHQVAINAAGADKPKRVLDAHCTNGDFAIKLARHYGAASHVVGIDLSPAMVATAKQKIRNLHLHRRIEIKTENVETMPFPNEIFDTVFINFTLRFSSDIRTVLKECYRVLKPGGTLLIMELSKPTGILMQLMAHVVREYWFPLWVKIKFGMPSSMAHYFHDSLVHYPDPDKLGRLMVRLGFDDVEYQALSRGIASLHRAFKPGEE